MRKDRHIYYGLRAATWMGALLFFACTQDEEIATNGMATSEVVTFAVSSPNQWQPDVIGRSVSTPSATTEDTRKRTEALPMDSEGDIHPESDVFMYMIEEDYSLTKLDTTSVDSRGGESATPDIGIYAFEVPTDKVTFGDDQKAVYKAADAELFMNTKLSVYASDNAEKKYWPGSGSYLQFFAYQPFCATGDDEISGLSVSASDNVPQFTYKVPTDVEEQKDLQVAKSDMLKGDNLQPVQMTLQHVLSKVQVKMGNVACGKVESISFKNIGGEGTYQFGADSWTVTDTDADDVTIATYSQTFADGYTPTDDKIIGEPFYLIPQVLPDDASIEIVLKVETEDPHSQTENAKRTGTYTLTKKLKGFVDKWVLDKQYTFVITTPQQVDVEVTDRVVGKVKQDLVIKNTGMSPAYIRAAIIGNWVQFDTEKDFTNQNGVEITEGKKIVAPWKDTDGVFDWGLGNGVEHPQVSSLTSSDKEKWTKDEDGYFYYTSIVPPGETTKMPLFETYTLTANAPAADAVLELVVAVQAVYPDDVFLLWKSAVKDALKMLSDDVE